MNESERIQGGRKTNKETEFAIKQIAPEAIVSDALIDTPNAASIRKPNIYISDDKFIAVI